MTTMPRSSVASLLALALASCGSAASAPVDAGLDGEGNFLVRRSYVIATLRTGSDLPTGQGVGLDLDGMVGGDPSRPCTTAPDLVSAVSGHEGVDNQMQPHWAMLAVSNEDGVDGAYRDLIEGGTWLVVVTIDDLNSYNNDDAIRVGLRVVRTLDGSLPLPSDACAAHADAESCIADTWSACSWSAAHASCSGIAAGQTFATVQDLGTFTGTIVGGRLLAGTSGELPIAIPAPANDTARIHDVQITAHVTQDALIGAELGGTYLVHDVLDLAGMFGGGDLATVESWSMPDLLPDATGAHCAGISVGFAFGAIAAVVP
jgi:hypothetical protein